MKCIFTSIFLLLVGVCNSQPDQYRFRFINLPDNFKGQYITLIEEDPAGMMWFVTNNGLHRYDGNQVLTFDMQSTPALPDVNIKYLFADRCKNLWIATRNKLVRFDLQNWTINNILFPGTALSSIRDRSITTIAEGRDSTMYVGTGNGKLYSVTGNLLHLITRLNMPASDTTGNYLAINNIQEPDKGELWLTTEKGQIVHIRHNKQQYSRPVYYEPKETRNFSLTFLTFSKAGHCLVQAPAMGVFLLNTANGLLNEVCPPPELPAIQNNAVFLSPLEDDKVAFFFGGYSKNQKGFGVYDFKENSFKSLNAVYPLSFQASILRNIRYKNKQVYISTDRGIAAVSYANHTIRTSLSSLDNINSIRTIYKHTNGRLYIGSYQQKFMEVTENTNEKKQLSEKMISCMIPWSRDTLLAGTEGGFLNWYIPETNRFSPVFKKNITEGRSAPINYIVCLKRENDTLVWAGTYAGCYLFNALTGEVLKHNGGMKDRILDQLNVFDIFTLGDNRYFATHEGLFKYNVKDGSVNKLFTGYDSIYSNASFSCMRMINNQIWAGTYGHGILVFDTSGHITKKITVNDGLASNIVFSIPFYKNYLLAGTGSGLSIIEVLSGRIRNYSSVTYLPSNEFNRSAWFVNGDTIYMGTVNGLVSFQAEQLLQQTGNNKTFAHFSSVTIRDGERTESDYSVAYRSNPSVVIPAGTKSFSIGLRGLDDAAAELHLYYRFGHTGSWQSIGEQREITFANMAPDNYLIQVSARMPDGQWTNNILTIPVNVSPLFYQTIWFKAILLALALLLTRMAIKYREKNLLREQRLRTRIADDLHDEVGSALTRIYFQADILSTTLEQSPNGLKQPLSPLQKIVVSSQEALSSMSDMVWSIDAHYDNVSDLVARMKDYIARLQEELDYKCTFDISGHFENAPLAQIKRQNIFLIFKEAVNNALKYAPERKLNVHISFQEKTFILQVKNAVRQLKHIPNIKPGGHGFQSMKYRAEKIKAFISIEQTAEEFKVILEVKNN